MMNLNIRKLVRAFFLVLLLHVECPLNVLSWRATEANVQCREKEKQALLELKHGLIDYYGRLSSWGNQDGDTDCCRWNGVRCGNQTGHVEMLDLADDTRRHPLRGEISTSLMNLQHLQYLNLSYNDFKGSHIPEFFGSLTKLRYLDLSSASFGGKIPYQLGKLSSLQFLDLSANNLVGLIPYQLGKLSSLQFLDLSGNNLVGLIPYQLGNLSNLHLLRVGENDNLSIDKSSAHAPWISNLSSLTEIGFRNINLHNSYKWLQAIGRLPNISKLWLSNCSLADADFLRLSSSQLNFSASLTVLDLSFNNITSWVFPRLFNKMPHLELLDLSESLLYGAIPESIGLLSELHSLALGGNFLEGVITDTHFANLTKLIWLSLYYNSLTIKFNNSWIPPFDLKYLDLDSCKVGPAFPKWLLTQNNLLILDISDAGISGAIPESLFCGDGNANNSLKSLAILDLSNNELSGKIPNCWSHLKSLISLDLDNNQLSGSVPITMSSLVEIRSLSFRNNNLTGELSSLKNCTKLVLLDAGENGLSGSVPSWIGDSMQSLEMLTLRKNHFNGSLPLQICHLTRIQILDLSLNNLSGQIPRCLKNFSAMAKKVEYNETMILWYSEDYKDDTFYDFVSYDLHPFVMWKGKELKFQNSRRLLKTIDLSNNQLSGEIPTEIGDLVELVNLNLSKNSLIGEIPLQIGNMHSLDSLDLSRNHFSGKIPMSLAQIDRLGVLDLSNNSLSGKIPTGTQLQGFDASVYEGNAYLCGSPLQRLCPGETKSEDPLVVKKHDEDHDDSNFMQGLYASMGLGFLTGFLAIFGSLLVFRSWRHAYFNFLNNVMERIIVMAIINIARCRRLINE